MTFIHVEAGDYNARSETCSKSEVNIGCPFVSAIIAKAVFVAIAL
jgi:hypothetical protein